MAMLSPTMILTWLEAHVKMRQSRRKALAAVVQAASAFAGVGITALGRAMESGTAAKHNIKRVNDFMGNEQLETEALAGALFHAFAPKEGRIIVLADWTDVANGKLLVFALPRDGRSLPFLSVCVPKDCGEGAMKGAEEEALDKLARICQGRDVTLVAVADRGFGHQRWLSAVRARGWHFVQRLSRVFFVEVEDYIGNLRECRLRKGARPKDWGHGTFGEDGVIKGRLITVYARDAKEPWYLVTDLEGICAAEVVGIYKRRTWIEALFRDHKNRDWGLSLDAVRFNKYKRYERLFYVLALAFIFLCAFGAAAEAEGFAQKLKANTVKKRTLNLLRIGHYYLREKRRRGESGSIQLAFAALEGLPS
jgi:hypothetical protein